MASVRSDAECGQDDDHDAGNDPHAGSQCQVAEPLPSHLIGSPLPATPVTPWSLSRQNSPGS
jgi:hypothetical protein